jgi:beta-galactosidase
MDDRMTESELPEGRHSPVARRAFLSAAAGGTAAVAAWSLLRGQAAGAASGRAADSGPAAVVIPLNTGWMFGLASGGGSPVPVTLPHTVTPLSWENWDPASWEQKWRYTNTFDAPPGTGNGSGLRVFLDFAGALTHSTITLNGTEAADFLGGYLPFSAEITSQLKPTGNQLSVLLDSGFSLDVPPDRPGAASKDVDFWQPGGIYRDVRLRVVPPVFIADVFAQPTKDAKTGTWTVPVQVTVDAAIVPDGPATVRAELLDGTRVVSSATARVTIARAGTQVTASTTLKNLGKITPWDIADKSPKLYTVVATLLVGATSMHDYQVRTGFRTISFQQDGFWLNGRRVKLFGLNRHQFYPFAGGAMPARVQAKDAQILRQELNCNMVRCSHYPQSEDFLDACDKYGLMVWEEAPGWDYIGDTAWQNLTYRDVRSMIIRDRNHPSVIIWGVRLNETHDDPAFYGQTQKIAGNLDRSRPTVGAMSSKPLTSTPQSYQQSVFSYNDYSHHTSPTTGIKTPYLQPPVDGAGRPYMVSEAIGALSGRFTHYRRIDDQLTQQEQATAHATVHDISASDSRYCGLLAWSGFDYPSGNSGNQVSGVKCTGVVDLFRIPKPGAAIYQAQVSPEVTPVIAAAFYWDFGATSPVNKLGTAAMICSNLDSLKVYVGGRLHATVQPDRARYGHLPYPPSFVDFSAVNGSARPELRVDGYIGSKKVASRLFSADHTADSLSLQADDASIAGDGTDATRVVFRALDQHGSPRPYVTGQVTFTITGPHTLVGQNPFDFGDTGAAGAIWIRSQPGSSGSVTVTASHPTLGDATLTISVVAAS